MRMMNSSACLLRVTNLNVSLISKLLRCNNHTLRDVTISRTPLELGAFCGTHIHCLTASAGPLLARCLVPRSASCAAPFLASYAVPHIASSLARFSTTTRYRQECELTHKRYSVKRGPYATITPEDLNVFRRLLGESGVLTTDLQAYNTDWLRSVRGESAVVLRPRTTEQVAQILRHCNHRKIAVCPQGGNTGLVGGSVPVFDEVIVSMSLMNEVLSVDELTGALTCQAGCVLQDLDDHLEHFGLMMPLDLGAKGSCHIGGNLATNAGGVRLLRYGSLQGSVLGVEAVLASGEVLDCMATLRKDNTGYHLKHLIIGSEGTLGIITKVALQCPRRPQSVAAALLSIPGGFPAALSTFRRAQRLLAEVLSSCEFVDASSMRCVTDNLGLALPVAEADCYLLLETHGSNSEHDAAKLEALVSSCLESGAVSDGVLATESSKMGRLWELRERIAEALLRDGYVYKYDLSVPLAQFYDLVEATREHLGSSALRCCGYGHLGDGNLHLNITTPAYDPAMTARLEPWLYEQTAAMRGSVSAEHGLGFKKRNCIHYSKTPSAVSLMHGIKRLMDPHNILNPYTCLPDEQ